MSSPYIATGAVVQEDLCDVMTVANYGATAIPAGSALVIDTTNQDTAQAYPAVAIAPISTTTARIGIAKTAIPAALTQGNITIPGVGQLATAGFVRGISASTAFTIGQQLIVSDATAGAVKVGTTAGAILGNIVKNETTTTPLILLAMC